MLFAALILCAGIAGACLIENVLGKIISVAVAILLILGLFFGMRWYFQNTASGQRAMTDQKSDLDNGLERTVTIYTADGEIIAQYTGKIDIEGNDGGYVLFDYEGKRYMSKHTTLDQLKMLAQRTKGEIGKVDSKMTALSDRVDTLESAGGQANVLEGVKVNGTALSIAEKMVDILIATGTANGTLSVNGKDVAIKGLAALAYKAQVSEADLDSALTAVLAAKAAKADVDTLIGSDAGKSARTIANEELTKQLIPEDAQESLNTLTEIAAWIQEHPDDASAMNAAIAKLNEIAAGIGGEEDDYATVMAAIEGKITAAMAGIAQGATKVEKSEINGNIKINGQETVVYTHPAGSAVEAGFKKVGSDASGHVVLGDDVTKEDITKLGIPGQDTTYEKATSEADGLMSKEDKAKLDGMAVAEDTEVQSMLDEIFGATEEEP